MTGLNKDHYKDRLEIKLAADRKRRKSRFNLIAIGISILVFAAFLIGTESGRKIWSQITWLTSEDATIVLWILLFLFILGLLLSAFLRFFDWLLEWLLEWAEDKRIHHD